MSAANLVELLTSLSREIVSNSLLKHERYKEQDQYEKKCIKKVRRTGLDVLMMKTSLGEKYTDPCEADYGGNWDPCLIILDQCSKVNGMGPQLEENVQELKTEMTYDVKNMLKLILMLKQTYPMNLSYQPQHPFSFSGQDNFFYTSGFDMIPNTFMESSMPGAINYTSDNELLNNENYQFLQNLTIAPTCIFREQGLPILDHFVNGPIHNFLQPCKLDCIEDRKGFETVVEAKVCQVKEEATLDIWNHLTLENNDELDEDIDILLTHLTQPKRMVMFAEEYAQEMQTIKNVYISRDVKSVAFFDNPKEVMLGLWRRQTEMLANIWPEVYWEAPLRVVSLGRLIHDIKLLLTGVPSESFVYNEEKETFGVVLGLCVEGITPQTLHLFLEQFLDVGTCYKRLIQESMKLSHNLQYGIIHQAYWKSVFEYLSEHQKTVLDIPSSCNLLELHSNTKTLCDTLQAVARMCCLWGVSTALPQHGGVLLSYLLQSAECDNRGHIQRVLLSFIAHCITVYIRSYLEVWMFNGDLPRGCDDFFIKHHPDKSKLKDRSYYLSFELKKEHVPDFMADLAERIFTCGKTVHLLKLFDSQSKLCHILEEGRYPTIKACFTERSLQSMQEEFNEYSQSVTRTCGKSVSVMSLREQDRLRQESNYQHIQTMQKVVSEQRELQQKAKQDLKRKRLEEQMRTLQDQVRFIESERRRRQMETELENSRIEEEINKYKDRKEKRIQEEKMRMRICYKELLNTEEKKMQWLTEREKELQLTGNTDVGPVFEDDNRNVLENDDSDKKAADKTKDTNRNDVERSESEVNGNEEEIKHVTNNMNDSAAHGIAVNNGNMNDSAAHGIAVNNGNMNDSAAHGIAVNNGNMNGSTVQEIAVNNANVLKSHNKESTITGDRLRHLETLRWEYETILVNNNISEASKQTDTEQVQLTLWDVASRFSEAQRNKRSILDCEYDSTRYKNPNRKEVTQVKMSHVAGTEWEVPDEMRAPLTEAQKNKLNITGTECESEAKDRTTTETKACQLTEAQKNKLKILGSEYGSEVRNAIEAERSYEPLTTHKDKVLTPRNVSENERLTKCGERDVLEVVQDYDRQLDRQQSSQVIPSQSDETLISPVQIDKDQFFQSFHFAKTDEVLCMNDISAFSDVPQYGATTDYFTEMEGLDCYLFKRKLHASLSVGLATQEMIANEAMLRHLLEENNFMSHVQSLRSYYFLNDGEFGRSLTQNMFRSLSSCSEPYEFFERTNLNSIVNEALNYTIHQAHSNAQNLSFKIVNMPKCLYHSSHDVLSSFELSYQVKWPLNILLTDKALSKYKAVFHFLLKLKRISWTLNENFLHLACLHKDPRINGKTLLRSQHFHKVQIYRHAMAQFVLTLADYIHTNGLETAWRSYLHDMETATTLDHLYEKHVRYVKDVLRRCFLTKHSVEVADIINRLVELGLRYHYMVKSNVWVLEGGCYTHPCFTELKRTYREFSSLTAEFFTSLRRKMQSHDELKVHSFLLEKLTIKLTLQD